MKLAKGEKGYPFHKPIILDDTVVKMQEGVHGTEAQIGVCGGGLPRDESGKSTSSIHLENGSACNRRLKIQI
jgi:hypothetical protein